MSSRWLSGDALAELVLLNRAVYGGDDDLASASGMTSIPPATRRPQASGRR
jgi:hypothetical protein